MTTTTDPTVVRRDRIVERALTLAYGNLIEAQHKPTRRDFRRYAAEQGWDEERFNIWARTRNWWVGEMHMQVPARSSERLTQIRKRSLEMHGAPPADKFTCDECGVAPTCTLVFDWYNTNGDCLAEK
jgi:hypothetical protein